MKNKEIEELLNKIKQQFIIDEKFAKDFHKTTLNYEETKKLLSYIEQLEKKVDKYENPDDLTLFYIWLDTLSKDKMKQMETEILKLKQYNSMITKLAEQLENNRDKAIEYIEKHLYKWYDLNGEEYTEPREFEKNTDASILIDILKGDSDGNL